MIRLDHIDAHCNLLFAVPPGAPAPPPLAEESMQGYVVLLSGHFQGFCRDLYSASVQSCAAVVPISMRTTLQAQFTAELALNTGNPKIENIRQDFERFGIDLNLLIHADPNNAPRITHLGHLNYWRNHVAHQKATPPPAGVPHPLHCPQSNRGELLVMDLRPLWMI